MGRNRKNEFEESSIAFKKESEFEVNQVKFPFMVNVTFKDKIGEYNDGKPIYGTTTVQYKKDISEKDEIIKEFQKDGKKEVLKVEEFTRRFSSLCPDCNRHGIPKIERKFWLKNKLEREHEDSIQYWNEECKKAWEKAEQLRHELLA